MVLVGMVDVAERRVLGFSSGPLEKFRLVVVLLC